MLIDNANFQGSNAALNKQPRITIALSLDRADTNVVYLTSSPKALYATGAQVLNDSLVNVTGVTQRVTPEKAISEIGTLSFDVKDLKNHARDGEFGAGIWSTESGDVTIENGQATYGGGSATLSQTNPQIVSGETYRVSFGIRGYVTGTIRVDLGGTNGTLRSANGVWTEEITAGGGGTHSFEEFSSFEGAVYGLSIENVNDTGVLTSMLESAINDDDDGIRRARAQVYVGMEGLAWTDYELRHTFFVDSVASKDGVYSFRCSDAQRFERKDIFDPDQTTLAATVTATDDHIPVFAANLTDSFFLVPHDAGYDDAPDLDVCYVKIGDEIIRCGDHPTLGNGSTALFTHATDGTSLHVLDVTSVSPLIPGRGALSSAAAAHDISAEAEDERQPKVEEVIYLQGPAVKLLRGILDGDIPGQGSEVYPVHWNAGMPATYIRDADFTGIGDDIWNATSPADGSDTTAVLLKFIGIKKQDAKRFIEREILLWLGAFMPVYANGEIGLRRFTPILAGAAYDEQLDDGNIVSYSALTYSLDGIINDIEITWNNNWLAKNDDDKFTKRNIIKDATSIALWESSNRKRWTFYGVHTSINTDNNLRTHFDTFRDRHAGPPLRLTLRVFHRLNTLEVGDVVRVTLPQIRDMFTATGLDRSFEIQRATTDWLTGSVDFELFGSSQLAAPVSEATLSQHLANSWYTSQGATELSTQITISGGEITSGGNLPAGDYYYLGNLQLNSGQTVTINGTVRLFIRGFFTQVGDFDGVGRGDNGGNGQTAYTDNSTQGQVGGFGRPWGAGGLRHTETGGSDEFVGEKEAIIPENRWDYTAAALATPPYNLIINEDGTTLSGLPTDLAGSGGPGGNCIGDYGSQVRSNGGDGGDGGAGLLIICRGMSLGAAADIDTSGDDAQAGSVDAYSGVNYYAGDGGGGSSGAFVLLMDGNYSPPTNAIARRTALHGASVVRGTRDERTTITYDADDPFVGDLLPDITARSSWFRGTQQFDQASALTRMMFIPAPLVVEGEVIPGDADESFVVLDAIAAPTIARGEGTRLAPVGTGVIVDISIDWSVTLQGQDDGAVGYELQAKRSTSTDWQTIYISNDLTQTDTTQEFAESEEWDFQIRVLSSNGTDYHSAWSSTTTGLVDISQRGMLLSYQELISAIAGTEFGSAIDMSNDGDWMIVGHNSILQSVSVLRRNPSFETFATLSQTGATEFGDSVAMSGDGRIVAIGEAGYLNTGQSPTSTGRVIVAEWDDTVSPITYSTTVIEPSIDQGGRFGASIAMSKYGEDYRLVIGEPGWHGGAGGADQGRAYVYRRTAADTWTQEFVIAGAGIYDEESFGMNVAISGDGTTIAIGAPTALDIGVSPESDNNGYILIVRRLNVENWDDIASSRTFGRTHANAYGYLDLGGEGPFPAGAYVTRRKDQPSRANHIAINRDGSRVAYTLEEPIPFGGEQGSSDYTVNPEVSNVSPFGFSFTGDIEYNTSGYFFKDTGNSPQLSGTITVDLKVNPVVGHYYRIYFDINTPGDSGGTVTFANSGMFQGSDTPLVLTIEGTRSLYPSVELLCTNATPEFTVEFSADVTFALLNQIRCINAAEGYNGGLVVIEETTANAWNCTWIRGGNQIGVSGPPGSVGWMQGMKPILWGPMTVKFMPDGDRMIVGDTDFVSGAQWNRVCILRRVNAEPLVGSVADWVIEQEWFPPGRLGTSSDLIGKSLAVSNGLIAVGVDVSEGSGVIILELTNRYDE